MLIVSCTICSRAWTAVRVHCRLSYFECQRDVNISQFGSKIPSEQNTSLVQETVVNVLVLYYIYIYK